MPKILKETYAQTGKTKMIIDSSQGQIGTTERGTLAGLLNISKLLWCTPETNIAHVVAFGFFSTTLKIE